jgi:hypothetical protein
MSGTADILFGHGDDYRRPAPQPPYESCVPARPPGRRQLFHPLICLQTNRYTHVTAGPTIGPPDIPPLAQFDSHSTQKKEEIWIRPPCSGYAGYLSSR